MVRWGGGSLYGKHFGKIRVLFLQSSLMIILWNYNVVSASILSTINRELQSECGLILDILSPSLVGGADEKN